MGPIANTVESILQDRKKTRNVMMLSVVFMYVFLVNKSFFQKSSGTSSSFASNYDPHKAIPDECKEEIIVNGSFREGTKGWKFIGPSTGMKLVPGLSGKALSTVTREQWFFGQAQTLNQDCLKLGKLYVIAADVKIEDYMGQPVSCDPFNKHFTPQACPTFALKVTGSAITTKDVGKAVGPWKLGEWNKLYGVFEATADIFQPGALELYITRLQAGSNAIVDNVSMKPVDESTYGVSSCHDLIRNGNADIGDARFWLIKGNGDAGQITVEEPGASGKFAFVHRGERQTNFNGMWQEIDQKCLTSNSTWRISFRMILLDSTGIATSCDKTQLSGDASCPTVVIESHTPDKGIVTDTLRNESPGHWESSDWNLFETTFTVSPEHLDKEETTIFINNIPSSYGYKVDDITMTRYLSEE